MGNPEFIFGGWLLVCRRGHWCENCNLEYPHGNYGRLRPSRGERLEYNDKQVCWSDSQIISVRNNTESLIRSGDILARVPETVAHEYRVVGTKVKIKVSIYVKKVVILNVPYHGVWKSQKKSHSTLRAKRATFTFWVDQSYLKMPKMLHFGDFGEFL